jgi:hypothetical protein
LSVVSVVGIRQSDERPLGLILGVGFYCFLEHEAGLQESPAFFLADVLK